jgi:ribosomal protein L24E
MLILAAQWNFLQRTPIHSSVVNQMNRKPRTLSWTSDLGLK